MRIIRLLLADKDQIYIESLTGYLMEKFPYKFQVNYFTEIDKLEQFILGKDNIIDIVLASQEFISRMEGFDKQENFSIIIELMERDLIKESACDNEIDVKRKSIYKYCHGDKLVQNIISIYEESLSTNLSTQKDIPSNKVISIYSPAGGAGKTTIAVNLARYIAKAGHNIFYINLESINSMHSFFGQVEMKQSEEFMEGSFSRLLYALKEKDVDIKQKLKEIIQYDNKQKIGYFVPQDNSLELDEIAPNDIKRLISEMKSVCKYDFIIMDLSSSFNQMNLVLMQESQEVVVITALDLISINKLKIFLKDIQPYDEKKEVNFLEKMSFVVNKCEENTQNKHNFEILNQILLEQGKAIEEIMIPRSIKAQTQNFDGEANDPFYKEIKKLANKYGR